MLGVTDASEVKYLFLSLSCMYLWGFGVTVLYKRDFEAAGGGRKGNNMSNRSTLSGKEENKKRSVFDMCHITFVIHCE